MKIFIFIFFIFLINSIKHNKKVMPWMCLERCTNDSNIIKKNLQQIKEHHHLLSGVSFELFNLGPNSQLITNNFTFVGPIISSYGLETYPMISSYPYPPEFLDWMKQLFKNPKPFINEVIKNLILYNFTGINIDFEPTKKANEKDAEDYSNFLTIFANELHKYGKKLTVDVASWNNIWNYTLLSKSTVDNIFVMSTYTGNWNLWLKEFDKSVREINIKKLGIGLETINIDNHNQPYSYEELLLRFNKIQEYHIEEIGIWKSPIPDNWWIFIENFIS